jgi:SAM-dependent methyltransferase
MGIEVNDECVSRARRKGLQVVQTPDCWNLREHGEFDVVTLCDVIEHMEDDRQALEAVWQALQPGGVVLVTVPALRSLWSSHDTVNHHFRRYRLSDLRSLFLDGRWELLRSSYFSSLLFPLIWTVRQMKNVREWLTSAAPKHDFAFGPPLVDSALRRVFQTEAKLLAVTRLAARELTDPCCAQARRRARRWTVCALSPV